MIPNRAKLRELCMEPLALRDYMGGLSNAQRRVAQVCLEREILPVLPAVEWGAVFATLFRVDSRAWLGCLLKVLVQRIGEGSSALGDCIADIAAEMTDVDRRKLLLAMIPLADSPEGVRMLFGRCGLVESGQWIQYLLQVTTRPAYFVLLGALRYVEHDDALLLRTCHYLMKKGDSLSFSTASIIRLSYDIKEVRGTFSLHLAPYQLARVEQNYAAFCEAVKI